MTTLREALVTAREDINWMLNNQKFLSPNYFNYIDKALAAEQEKDLSVRGELTALKCWHRLSGTEAQDLIDYFQSDRNADASKTIAQPGWSPIETAPKLSDKSILVWLAGRFNKVDKTCFYNGELLFPSKEHQESVTHWMPLPTAPAQQCIVCGKPLGSVGDVHTCSPQEVK